MNDTGTVHWIRPGGTVVVETNVQSPSFDKMKEFLDGHSEHVSVLYKGKPASMFVHEFGRILGLPRNAVATEIYFAASRARGKDPMAEFEARETTDPKPEDAIPGGGVLQRDTQVINLDPTPNEPPGIHGPAILLEGFPL
ncbi:hypothetical protein LCGC14_1306380 [marine sediment metagenome]|uniref:Uncharacterized protein n=1 Tax=marine sediment metagenome TaxID=412755 RepID=A0A0F9KP87_9ZZZZ